ncbi:molybdenum cofactor synthesis domain [Staphylothermus marinus F1]|uniref:Molybdenum cofactor synthesis domain n=1 Tax=Staphylothermus marinus (strain ATCC 43588 / DSM 3639 / JCM 9404 / F1) TaxID=399550 RepID=A3DPU6_STAMF|nr:gephyrin-like molybdotransferase Glp [Staphylothermus marinus]ABN70656.1 molybdenum cofactor synthesis domain [Staphylothermus marinus F1]
MVKFLGSLISVDEAVEKATKAFKDLIELRVVEKTVWDALYYVSSEDVVALIDQPRYDRSAVDGYAVISSDTTGASPTNPAILRVKGYMSPSSTPDEYIVKNGEAVELTTGSPLPLGADAVVMYEDTYRVGDEVEIYKSVPSGANVAKKGEDYKKGEVLVKKNTLLKPWHLSIIASTGINTVKVFEKMRIGIIASGSELVEPGYKLDKGQIYNSTSVLVKNYIETLGFTTSKYYGVFPDEKEALKEALFKALRENHLVITTGGTGVSDEDVIRDIVDEYGEWVFRGVAMRPGRPTSAAIINDKPVFLLSGYPVAAWTGLEAIVSPTLYNILDLEKPVKPVIQGVLARRVPNTVGYRSYIRVTIRISSDNKVIVEPYMLKGSGVLSSLVKTNGYIILYENVEGYEKGSIVDVILY